MLRRVPCYGCAFCASLRDTAYTTRHAATTPNWYSEINVTFYGVTLARTIWLPDDGPRTETCRNLFNVFYVLLCKFYKFYKLYIWYNNWVTQQHARCNNENKTVHWNICALCWRLFTKYRITVERKTLRIKFEDMKDIHALYPTHNINRSSAVMFVRKIHKSVTIRTFPNCVFNNKP